MASTINNDGAFYPASTTIVLRANSAGNPIWHNQVDGNFENLRLGHNQVVTELATKSIIGHVHSVVTTSVNGFMSSADKAKLDGVASGANNYALPTATSSTKGGVKVGSNLIIQSEAIGVPTSSSSIYGVVKYDNSSIKLNGNSQLYAVDDGHGALTNNPHNVTASQVGLGSVVSDIAAIQSGIGSDSTNTGMTIWENLLAVENKGNVGRDANLQEIQALRDDLNSSDAVFGDTVNGVPSIKIDDDNGASIRGPIRVKDTDGSYAGLTASGLAIIDHPDGGANSGSSLIFNGESLATPEDKLIIDPLPNRVVELRRGVEVDGNLTIGGNVQIDGDITVSGSGANTWKSTSVNFLSNEHIGHNTAITINVHNYLPNATEVCIEMLCNEQHLQYYNIHTNSWVTIINVGNNVYGGTRVTIPLGPGNVGNYASTINNIVIPDIINPGIIRLLGNGADGNGGHIYSFKAIYWR